MTPAAARRATSAPSPTVTPSDAAALSPPLDEAGSDAPSPLASSDDLQGGSPVPAANAAGQQPSFSSSLHAGNLHVHTYGDAADLLGVAAACNGTLQLQGHPARSDDAQDAGQPPIAPAISRAEGAGLQQLLSSTPYGVQPSAGSPPSPSTADSKGADGTSAASPGRGSTSPYPSPVTAVRAGATLGDGTVTSPPPKGTTAKCSVLQTPARRSTRHRLTADGASVTDEDSMAKAMRRKASVNLDNGGHLQVYSFAPFMVVASASGGPRPLYGGVYTVGGNGQVFYYPT
nr:flocculation protein FLO11-like [Lolium perenne]